VPDPHLWIGSIKVHHFFPKQKKFFEVINFLVNSFKTPRPSPFRSKRGVGPLYHNNIGKVTVAVGGWRLAIGFWLLAIGLWLLAIGF